MRDETLDRLTSAFRIIQKRSGHRVASDDTLLAWAACRAMPGARRVLDLGSGKGAVAMLMLSRLPGCRVLGIEALASNHDLALRNAALNILTDRWEPRLGDLREPSALSGEEPFDLVTGAPPFMPLGSGVLPRDPQRAAGRFELRGGVRDYAITAARHLAPGGFFVLLMDGLRKSRARAETALAAAGFHVRLAVSVRPCPDRASTYAIFVSSREHGPLREELLVMRDRLGGPFSAEYEAIRREMDVAG
ncbi:MAG: SAM-dependent methyltransferase [Deltaproteobacteria bacterium]|nr:SAM-dependent methyltransferase [Deltaproteobacteria bacterium]